MVGTREDHHSKTLHIIIYCIITSYFLLDIDDDDISISYSENKTFKKIKNKLEIQNVNIVHSNNNMLTCLVHFYIIQY